MAKNASPDGAPRDGSCRRGIISRMRALLFASLVSPALSFAVECHLVEVKAVVQAHPTGYALLINRGTLAERLVIVGPHAVRKLTRFKDATVKGEFIFAGPYVTASTPVLAVQAIARSNPDPLQQAKDSYVKPLRSVPCP